MKICTSCRKTKPVVEFRLREKGKDGTRRLRGWCIACQDAYNLQWARDNYVPKRKKKGTLL